MSWDSEYQEGDRVVFLSGPTPAPEFEVVKVYPRENYGTGSVSYEVKNVITGTLVFAYEGELARAT